VDRADHDPYAHRYRSRVALLELPYERADIEEDEDSGADDVRQLRRHRDSALTASVSGRTRYGRTQRAHRFLSGDAPSAPAKLARLGSCEKTK
jgi:hypothetical protein